MTWFRIDDSLWGHPKWLRLAGQPSARALWATAGSWAAANLTDGHVPEYVLGTLGGRPRDAAALVDARLWVPDQGGWRFHDWTEMNPTREQVLAERAAAAERQRRFRARRLTAVPDDPGDPGARDVTA